MKIFWLALLTVFLSGCMHQGNIGAPAIPVMGDHHTPAEIPFVDQTDSSILIEYRMDSMDRGAHHYMHGSHHHHMGSHGKLVVELDYTGIQRGDVIYTKSFNNEKFEHPYLARVVGLPGETVSIKKGQVYIDNIKLVSFYSKATMRGMEEEEYFETMDPKNIGNEAATREYFATQMDPVEVTEGTVFVLVDQWWRGRDSRDYGLLPIHQVEGKVLGYHHH